MLLTNNVTNTAIGNVDQRDMGNSCSFSSSDDRYHLSGLMKCNPEQPLRCGPNGRDYKRGLSNT